MDAETLKALKGSIAKWEAIVAGTGVDRGRDNCPLCQMFNSDDHAYRDRCVGCPVYEQTGLRGCEDTPYDQWRVSDQHHGPDAADTKIAAQAELDFLRFLLPAGADRADIT